jgi:NRPS condensation-like uncharacterized protein
MPFAPPKRLPTLAPLEQITRRLSTPEYYQACVGTHPRTLEPPREAYCILESEDMLAPERWREALHRIAAANPGVRLRLVGRRRAARWQSDGAAPQVRVIENCTWDARSSKGAEFIWAEPLSLERGPVIELILARRTSGTNLVILRSHHAFMDASGIFHALHELFRALRGEALLGSNANFSDVELMRSMGVRHSTSRHLRTTWLTGPPQGEEVGDDWRRIALGKPKPQQLAQLAVAFAEFAHRYSDLPALIAVPVDLRRHCPELRATTNFSSMVLVRLDKGDGPDLFRSRLGEMLDQRMETVFPRALDAVRWLPLPWFDLLVSRTPRNYQTRKPMETALVSNVGRIDLIPFSAPGFATRHVFFAPLAGSAFSALSCISNEVEIVLNLPRVLSSNGRFDELESFLRQRFADRTPTASPSEPCP